MRVRASLFVVLIFFYFLSQYGMGQQLGFNLVGDAKRVDIPFESYNNLIVIPVVINNSIPLKFVLDTGVRNAILTEKVFADILNLSYKRKISIAGAGGENIIEAYVTNNISLDLPGVEGQGHAMLVLEQDYLQLTSSLGAYVHGIIGYEVFSRFVVRIDYSRQVVSLIEPDSFKPKKKYTRVPIVVEDTKPYIHADVQFENLERIKAKLLVDTGASHSLLLEKDSDDKINIPQLNMKTYLGRGLAGNIKGKVGRVRSLKISNRYQLKNVITSFPDKDSYADSLAFGDIDRNGTIGGGILSRFTTYIDFSRECIYIKKNSTYKKPFTYNLSGMSVIVTGNNLENYVISDIREGSPAAQAGFLSGDEILKINFTKVNSMELKHVYNFLNRKANKKLRILIRRDNGKLLKELHLKHQI